MPNYAAKANSALASIQKNGAAIVLEKLSTGTGFDAISQGTTGKTKLTETHYAMLWEGKDTLEDKASVKTFKRMLMVAANIDVDTPATLIPARNDVYMLPDGFRWSVGDVTALAPDGVTVIYWDVPVSRGGDQSVPEMSILRTDRK